MAEVAADVESVVSLVLVDEVVDEAQERGVADVVGEHGLEGRAVDRRVVFADVEFDEASAVAFPCPSFDGASGVDGAAAGDAGGLPSADLGVEEGLESPDGDVVVDLVSYGLASDDPVFPGDGFGAVEVSDGGVAEVAVADFIGDLSGEFVEVGVAFEELLDVAS